jgi:hypothetical protein
MPRLLLLIRLQHQFSKRALPAQLRKIACGTILLQHSISVLVAALVLIAIYITVVVQLRLVAVHLLILHVNVIGVVEILRFIRCALELLVMIVVRSLV